MRTIRLAAALAAFSCAAGPLAFAQTTAPQPPQPGPAKPVAVQPAPAQPSAAVPVAPGEAAAKPDPVVARVGADEIHLSEVQEAAAGVPAEYRQLPPQVLFPMVLDQVVDRHAVAAFAHKQGMDQDPQVKRAMDRAAENALENAAVSRAVKPLVTEQAIKARYDETYANKPGEQEVHARHILVASEDDAKKIIDELKKGGDFAAIAKTRSTDPGAAQGGDLGWFKKGDMLPEFSAVAFALKPGETSQTPVHTRYGWHVIKVEGVRTAQPPTFEQAHDEIRQQIIQQAVQNFVKQSREGIKVVKFNPDGTVPKPGETVQPMTGGPAAPDAASGATDSPPPPTPAQ